jgi:hypothetical protein
MAGVLVAPGEAAAQTYRPEAFERAEPAPAQALALSPSAVQHLNNELDGVLNFQSMDAFGGKRGVNGFGKFTERPGPWVLYGRAGIFNYQSELNEPRTTGQFTWRRTGPSLTGRIYFGVRKQF